MIKKVGRFFWLNIYVRGRRIRRSLKTGNKYEALDRHKEVKDRLLAEHRGGKEIKAPGAGLPGWSHWKDAWIIDFRGMDVVLVLDADDAGQKGTRDIAGRFIHAGLPAPRQLMLEEGTDLNDFYRRTKGGT